MNEEGYELQIFESDDGILAWGDPRGLALLDENPSLVTLPCNMGTILSGVSSVLAAKSAISSRGRWLKLTEESADFLKQNRVKNPSKGVVLRRDLPGGKHKETQTAKWLKFEPVAILNPEIALLMAVQAQQKAIEKALEELKEYLEEIDAKLDRMIQSRKDDYSATVDGILELMREAKAMREETGHISAVTWSKVQGSSEVLLTIQMRAIRGIATLARDLQSCGKDIDKSAKEATRIKGDIPYWLGLLAMAIDAQDKLYLVELDHVAEAMPDELDAHRRGITRARRERKERIASALKAIQTSINEQAKLTNLGHVANPFSSRELTKGAKAVHGDVENFAEHVDILLGGLDKVSGKKWMQAVQGLAGDVAGTVSQTVDVVHSKIDEAVVAQARKLVEARDLQPKRCEEEELPSE